MEKCNHDWTFVRNNEEGMEDYFRCEKCHLLQPYEPMDLEDMIAEMEGEE